MIALLLELLSVYNSQRKLRARGSNVPESGEFLAGPSIANG